MGRTLDDITGKRFGKWLVVEKVEGTQGVCNSIWKCKCDCGTEKSIKGINLIRGKSKSCGCLKTRICTDRFSKHGMSDTKVYQSWEAMIARCECESNVSYENYHSKGISVCSEWRDSFETFYEYVSKLEHFGEKGYSLDRINNNDGYKPGNVRWADRYTQNNNTSKNIYIELNGETKTLAQWVKLYDLKYYTVLYRMRRGWSAYEALTTPVKETRRWH